jgi:hypothetical protein
MNKSLLLQIRCLPGCPGLQGIDGSGALMRADPGTKFLLVHSVLAPRATLTPELTPQLLLVSVLLCSFSGFPASHQGRECRSASRSL